jgi:GT2 family glycosyltransferase
MAVRRRELAEQLEDDRVVPLPVPVIASFDDVDPDKHPLRLSLIVPATDDPTTLEPCLAAIESSIDPPAEVIVVEDAPGRGASVARNYGAFIATGDILVFVDADVVVHPDAISRLHAHFEARPETSAVFGSYDDTPGANGTVSVFRNLLHHHVHQGCGGPVGTFWTGLGAIRREAFDRVGGFDSEVFGVEDIDLGIRLAQAGEEIVLDPAILGKHLKDWSFWRMVKTDFSDRAVPWIDLILRHGHASTDLNLGWRHRGTAAALVIAVVSAAMRWEIPLALAAASFVALNLSFYRTLRRRQGLVRAICGIGLHAVHHGVSVAAVPYALARHAGRACMRRLRSLRPAL